jgi:cell division protein FtsQ
MDKNNRPEWAHALKIFLQVVVWAAVVAYMVFAVRHCRGRQRAERLETVNIAVTENLSLADARDVRGWLDSARIDLEGAPLEAIDTRAIADLILAQPYMESATVWVEQSGVMYIEAAGRRPVLRIARGDGYDSYLTEGMHLIPTRPGVARDVPVVSGEIPVENFDFLAKLSNFVLSVVEGAEWKGRIVQIVVHAPRTAWNEPEIELIPREGRFRIVLGELEGAQEKMDKLALMYRNVLPHEGWDTYAVLDISNEGQVVATK